MQINSYSPQIAQNRQNATNFGIKKPKIIKKPEIEIYDFFKKPFDFNEFPKKPEKTPVTYDNIIRKLQIMESMESEIAIPNIDSKIPKIIDPKKTNSFDPEISKTKTKNP